MKRIALIGDSHAKVVFKHLVKILPDLGFNNVYTRAENGWSVKQHIKKETLPQLKASKPDVVLVSLGGNNFDMSPSRYRKTVDQLLDVAKDVGAQVIWVGPTTSSSSKASKTEKRHKKTHEMLAEYLPSKSVYYIDNRSFTAGGWGKDGIHYPSSFYKKWAQRVAKYLNKIPTKSNLKKYAIFGGVGLAVITTIVVVVKIAFGGKKGSQANQTKCLTPGAKFHTNIKPRKISMEVDLPMDLDINQQEAEILETVWHNATESVLRPYFYDKKGEQNE